MQAETDQELARELDRFDRLIMTLFATNAAYHNEKERMSHNIILLEMALLGAAITSHHWFSLSKVQYSSIVIMSIFVAACGLVHMHLRWQLRNRRSAAIHVAAIQNAMVKWINAPPTREEMAPQPSLCIKPPFPILTLLDLLLPVKAGLKVGSDASLPSGILQEILRQKKTPLLGEWLTSGASVVLLVAAFLIFASPSA